LVVNVGIGMLIGDLYTLKDFAHGDRVVTTTLLLNPAHPIFAGHYPGQPILPGACILQVVKEILSSAIEGGVMLVIANNLKFLLMIDPVSMSALELKLTYQEVDEQFLKVTASLHFEEKICFKFQGSFRRV
jgi:3-hydroxyacyl-[acyl-carrier-protein] dehydratase